MAFFVKLPRQPSQPDGLVEQDRYLNIINGRSTLVQKELRRRGYAGYEVPMQTVFGSTKLVMDTGMHPAELKDMVVSPGGTTAEALRVLEDRGVPAAIVSAVDAAYRKSIQLGQG